jgi:hypothetical protein
MTYKRPSFDLTSGPKRENDGLPVWIEWNGEQFDTPSFEEIESWVYDSVCEALDGSRIEPDGWTHEGCPSWLLALGLI